VFWRPMLKTLPYLARFIVELAPIQLARCPLAPAARMAVLRFSCVLQTWLGLFLREFPSQLDRRNHTVGPRDAFARYIERGAMIGAGARKGQAESHVHTAVKGVKFKRDQTLIVIHAKGGVPFPVSKMEKKCVRGDGAFEGC